MRTATIAVLLAITATVNAQAPLKQPIHQHAVVVLTAYPDAPNYWDWDNLRYNVYVSSSSSNAPQFKTGDNFAQAIADCLDAGLKPVSSPVTDQYGWQHTIILVK